MSKVTIYTDGACEPNPGIGGWAAILMFECSDGDVVKKEITGNLKESTNNRMEMTAVLEGLRALKKPCKVTIFSDSKYVIDGTGCWESGQPKSGHVGWLVGWKKKNWTKSGGLKNVDLWKAIHDEVIKHHLITMTWVRGHVGHEHNERCDELAVAARKTLNDTVQGNGLRQNGDSDDSNEVGSTSL